MLKEERKRIISDQVRLHNRVLITDLSEKLEVSIDTVRRDVKELDSERVLKKVHGGAISLGYNTPYIKEEEIYHQEKKALIAQKAIGLLQDGQVILIGGGTTNMELARLLPDNLHLTVFTPSIPVASRLLLHPNSEVFFIGGKLSHHAKISIGGTPINALSQIRVDLCFLGTGYLDPEHGLTEIDLEIIEIKRTMIAASKKTILLTISEKLNTAQRYKTCDLSSIHTLITELDPKAEILDPFRSQLNYIY